MDEERWAEAGRAWDRLSRRLAARGAGALDALSDVAALRRVLEEAELAAVRAARAAGRSWAEIATMLGVTRQSAWEKWRELDASGAEPAEGVRTEVIGRAARAARRRGTVTVPNLIGMPWWSARSVLREHELLASGADPDDPPDSVVTDQSPESGARVPAGSTIRLWFERGGGTGVREPRRPRPDPRTGRAMRDEEADESVG
jgi:hypothetical protein